MKKIIVNTIEELAENDPKLALITADLGFGVLDNFVYRYPKQFYNMGISEQAMASVAAGMALEGHCVFTYSIGNFPTLRCIEQIRNDICYHKANVKIVAVGCGFTYGQLGMSHHATEDIAMMRALPEMRVYCPSSAKEAQAAVRAAYANGGPCYIRVTQRMADDFSTEVEDIHRIKPLCSGEDLTIFTCGDILSEVLVAQRKLREMGYKAKVCTVPSVKPLDAAYIRSIAADGRLIVSVEEHTVNGGLGGAIGEVLSEMSGNRSALLRLGLQDCYPDIVGSQMYLRDRYGLSAEKIVRSIAKRLGE